MPDETAKRPDPAASGDTERLADVRQLGIFVYGRWTPTRVRRR